MPATERRIVRADLLSDAEFSRVRKARRAELLPHKRLRRVEVGPACTFYFESYDTMLFQVQEMLLTERGGEAQVEDELSAYNPLIPQGRELVATVMFEVDDPVRREALLSRLGRVDEYFVLQIGAERVKGVPEGDVERTREDGKTSSVHFLHFPLTDALVQAFADPSVTILVGCEHPSYSHFSGLGPDTRAELSRDFS
jgi:hypothetical protein